MATLPAGQRILARDLADATQVPRQFLGKILHRLARHGVLESAKGRGGGFRFSRLPESVTLGEVVEMVQGTHSIDRCVLGLAVCDETQPCPLHDQWMPFCERLHERVHGSTLADLARSLKPRLPSSSRTPSR